MTKQPLTALRKLPVSVLIPARNEEANLPACLESVSRADEVFVVDSQSSDRSIEISESYGANVVQFHFNGRSPKKKNWSLENLPFRNEWVLIVDCDERITPELWAEIEHAIENPEFQGYYLNRKVFFLGQWIRLGASIPTGIFVFSVMKWVVMRTLALKECETRVTMKFTSTSS